MKGQLLGAAPIGGPVLTKPFLVSAAIGAAGLAAILYRFVFGLGAATALGDGYPWGAWKVLNVIVLTAIGSGGYATALLVYILNRHEYHPLVRTAILTSALGYTTGVLALGVDIGRPWNFWRIAFVNTWNLHSPLLEVAVCISVYLVLLWLEMAHPFLESWAHRPAGRLRDLAVRVGPGLEKATPFILAGAIVLPTMHQSSLGSLFLLSGPRIHPLWQTPILPLLFLLSCWALGYACVALVWLSASIAWRIPAQTPLLGRLARVESYVLVAFVVVRLADVVLRGEAARLVRPDGFAVLFWTEIALLVAPAAILAGEANRRSPRLLYRAALLTLLGGGLYRLDAALVAFQPGGDERYFPSLTELLISAGFVALAFCGFLYVVKRYPILTAAATRTCPSARPPSFGGTKEWSSAANPPA